VQYFIFPIKKPCYNQIARSTNKGKEFTMFTTHFGLFSGNLRKCSLGILAALVFALLFSVQNMPHVSAASSACINCSVVVQYVHQNFLANTQSYYTDLNNQYLNNNPSARVIVTDNYTPLGDTEETGPDLNNVGVWYHNGHWAIFNENHAPMPTDAAFNVYAIIGTGPTFVQTATAANSAYDYTDIDNALTNNQPNAKVFVTQNWNPNGTLSGQYDNHPLGVWYHNGKWSIFNEDGTAIPANASFNVVVQPNTLSSLFVQTATAANSFGDVTCMNNSSINFNQSAAVFVTPNWDLGSVYVPYTLTVEFHADINEWCINNIAASAIPLGAAFNVFS
jgi:hypothetical protein